MQSIDATLPVNEIFQTVQGEASFTGTPAVFIRLQGCSVGCPWCDTKHTWNADKDLEVSPVEVVGRLADAPTWASMTIEEIVEAVRTYPARHVVITGGEPAIHNLEGLTAALVFFGYSIQLETSGTVWPRVHPLTFVTVSPKVAMPGGLPVNLKVLQRANEIKHPVGKMADVEVLEQLLEQSQSTAVVYLQPLSLNRTATDLCVRVATAKNWRVSIQTHKLIAIR